MNVTRSQTDDIATFQDKIVWTERVTQGSYQSWPCEPTEELEIVVKLLTSLFPNITLIEVMGSAHQAYVYSKEGSMLDCEVAEALLGVIVGQVHTVMNVYHRNSREGRTDHTFVNRRRLYYEKLWDAICLKGSQTIDDKASVLGNFVKQCVAAVHGTRRFEYVESWEQTVITYSTSPHTVRVAQAERLDHVEPHNITPGWSIHNNMLP